MIARSRGSKGSEEWVRCMDDKSSGTYMWRRLTRGEVRVLVEGLIDMHERGGWSEGDQGWMEDSARKHTCGVRRVAAEGTATAVGARGMECTRDVILEG